MWKKKNENLGIGGAVVPGMEGVLGAYDSSVVTVDRDGEGGTRLRESRTTSCESGQESGGPAPRKAGCRTPARKEEGKDH